MIEQSTKGKIPTAYSLASQQMDIGTNSCHRVVLESPIYIKLLLEPTY